MAPTTMIRPPVPALDAPAVEVIFRPLSPEEQIEHLYRWANLETLHPLPAGANDTMRRIWLTLLDYDGALSSRELAAELHRHRGNIDRALTRLREAGLVYRTARGLHRVVPESQRS